jgi:hypothetical protein
MKCRAFFSLLGGVAIAIKTGVAPSARRSNGILRLHILLGGDGGTPPQSRALVRYVIFATNSIY